MVHALHPICWQGQVTESIDRSRLHLSDVGHGQATVDIV